MNEPVAAWMAVLDRIELSLTQSLARTREVPPATRQEVAAQEGPLARLDQRFEQWRACLERIERAASGAEGDLDADQKGVSEWLAATAAARRRLAARLQGGDNGA